MTLLQKTNLQIKAKTVALAFMMLVSCCIVAVADASGDYDISEMFRFAHLSAADGLPSQRVFSIVESNDHAIWIATKNGIERYNGVTMQQYNPDINVTSYKEMTSRIFRLYKSKDGQLYAFSNSGKIFRYDVVSNSFLTCCDFTKSFQQQIILNDISIVNGQYWLALNTGLYRYEKGGKLIPVIRNAFVNDITESDDGLYVGTNSGVFHTDFHSKVKLLFAGIQVQSAYYDAPGHKLFIGTFNSGLYLADVRTLKLYPESPDIPHRPVRAITPMNSKTMLVGVDGGGVVGISRADGRKQFDLTTDDETGAYLHGNGVYDICLDEWGNVWIGSYSGGVDIAYAVDNAMKIISHEYLNPQSLTNNNVNDVFDDGNGNIYYATDRGVSTYHIATDTWTHTMEDIVCLNFARDIDGTILVASYGGGVRTIGGEPVYTKENGKLKTDYVYSIYNDGKGKLWIGCLDGDLTVASATGQQFYNIQNVQTISGMPDGRTAIATANGLYAIDSKGQQSHYFTAGEFPSSDVNIYITSMLFTSPNEVLLGTDGGGVYIYNMRLHSYRQLTTRDGLPSNCVKSIISDKWNRIWVTTDHGMVYVTQKPKTRFVAVNLPHEVGLEFNRDAATILHDGRLAFGSTSGAILIKPDVLTTAKYKAPIQLRDIVISGLDRDEAAEVRPEIYHMLSKGKVVLPYSQNTFTLEFESINLKYQYDIAYQYFIEGQQDNALQSVDDGRILFNNMSPGTYHIHLRSISRSTGQIISERILEIKIRQPWWNSLWAWIIYLCIIGGIVYTAWRFYRNRLMREYDAERINFFVNTAHDIRTPLSLTLAPLDDISQDKTLSATSRKYLDIARRNGKQLMTLISTLLDFQKIDAKKIQLHVTQIDLRSLLEHACSRFNLLSEQKHITLSLVACPDNATVWVDEKAANRILDNLISNAIKYTRENGDVEVGAREDNSHIIIYVRDNGIGIPEKAQRKIFSAFYRAENAVRSKVTGSGLGLMLVKKLVELHHGSVSFESREGKGTTFTVTLPKGFRNIAETTEHTERPAVTDDKVTPRDSGTTLLFVDDNAELRNYMELVFGKKYNVVTKPDAQSALDYLAADSCDIIISDVMMPGMQGDEFCSKVKADEATSFIPVILLTAKAGRDYTISGLNCGADDYISKPFDTAVLQAKVESMLRSREALRNYYIQRAKSLASSTSVEGKTENNSTETVEKKDSTDTPKALTLKEDDKEFVDKATRIVMENMHEESFDINVLCREMAMSRTLFYNRLKALTGQTPQDFIRILRLTRAAALLDNGKTVLEASTNTGFTNAKYFSTIFKKHFGVSPSKYHSDN